jgi:predicted PurR-regulated permease PerM
MLTSRDPIPQGVARRPYRTGLVAGFGALSAVTIWGLLGQLTVVLWCVAVAVFLAMGLHPLARLLERRGLRRPLAAITVTGSVVLAIGGAVLLLLPPLLQQTAQLVGRARELVADGGLDQGAARLQQLVPVSVLDVRPALDSLATGLTSPMGPEALSSGVISGGTVLGDVAFVTTVVVVLTAYFLISHRWFAEQLIALFPRARRASGAAILTTVATSVGRYFAGQVGLAALYGVLSLVVLLATGSALPILLAAFAAVAALVPVVGIAASGVGIVAVQALVAPSSPTWIVLAVWYLTYLLVEAYVIAPRVARRTTAIPDIVTILVTLVGGTLFGILGALLAVPAAVAVGVCVQEARGVARADDSARGEHRVSDTQPVPIRPTRH